MPVDANDACHSLGTSAAALTRNSGACTDTDIHSDNLAGIHVLYIRRTVLFVAPRYYST